MEVPLGRNLGPRRRKGRTGAHAALVFLAGLALARPAIATESSYRSCQIANGQILSCGAWYQGEAVVQHDGAYRSCRIANGQVLSCGAWYQGETVAFHDGAYRSCKIANGQIFSCGAWYQGAAVVLSDR